MCGYDKAAAQLFLFIGLSLVEALTLVLFLLLLAAAARLAQVQQQANDAQRAYAALQATIPTLRPLLERGRQQHQLHTEDPQELVVKLTRAMELEKAAAELSRENADLRSQLASRRVSGLVVTQEIHEVSSIMERATQIYPADPRAVLNRALAVLERFGPEVDVDRLSPMKLDDELRAKVAHAETGRFPFPRESDNVDTLVSGISPRKAKFATAPGGARRRPGCTNSEPLRSRRPAGLISIWCP